jgi:hypothetical protein
MKKYFDYKKTGELTTTQIVTLIILLVSFIIILFLLFRLNIGKESDSDICHNSVVTKGNPALPAAATPLKCSRTYICITKDGSCESMTKPEIKKVKTKEEVYNVLAEEMANCWWMFGEGKVDYIGKDPFFKDNYCSICSQIAFDNSLNEIEGIKDNISKDDFYNYLSLTPVPDKGINYAEYFFGTNDINGLKAEVTKNQSAQASFGIIKLDKQQFILMGITSEVAGRGGKIAAGSVVTVVGFFVGYSWVGLAIGAVIVGAGEYGAGKEVEIGAILVDGNGIKNTFMAPTIQEANSESLKKLNCYEIITST